MYFFGYGVEKIKNEKNLNLIFLSLKPYLNHGTIILTSTFQNFSSLFSPTPIKHSSFCYIEGENYYAIELSNTTKLKKQNFISFLKKRDSIFLFNYHDLQIMNKTMDYIFNYKDSSYGFFGNKEYCYKLIFNVYRDVYKNNYNILFNKMSDFFPVINFFGLEYVNANSILESKKFIPTCCLINDIFVIFKS